MNCYYYETIGETGDPIITNSDLTLILVMENTTRFNLDPFILKLSRKTVIQYNKGFKNCEKEHITLCGEDINHAYYTAFSYTKDYNNVLFLEEDAEVLNYDLNKYIEIDKYISQNNYSILSFGTFGTFVNLTGNFYIVNDIHGAHSQLISKTCRTSMINHILDKKFKGYIDETFMSNRGAIVYDPPLMAQKFPQTDNNKEWANIMSTIGIKLFNLDNSIENFDKLHLISKIRGILLFLFLVVIIFLFSKYMFY